MIKLLFIILIGIFYVGFMQPESGKPVAPSNISQSAELPVQSGQEISAAFAKQQSNIQVRGQGTVAKVLKDDNDGHRHQRFILRLADGHTVLVAHNTDLAQRIDGLKAGDTVAFYGEYEWNPKGGVVHWTHHDPRHTHIDGWLKHDGNTYQ